MAQRQDIVGHFLALAAIVEQFSRDVAEVIRLAAEGKTDIPYTWLVRWSRKGREWDHIPTSPERIVGHAWVLAACGEGQEKLPWIIRENGKYCDVWVKQVEPLNKSDLEDAKRARELGMNVSVQPKYPQPKPGTVAIREEFEKVVKTARSTWVDDSIRGHVVTGHEPGWDEEGRTIDVPTFGEAIEYGPGFRVDGVPEEWVGTYSRLTAFTENGMTRFEAHFSDGGGPVNINDVPDDAEWRIPRYLVEQILGLMEETSILLKEEEEKLKRTREEKELKRLAAKFAVTTGPSCGYCGNCEYCNYGQQ